MLRYLVVTSLAVSLCASQAFGFAHGALDALLDEHVVPVRQGQASMVDYRGLRQDEVVLDGYLDELAAVSRASFDSWTLAEQLAFLINAYNAWTLKLIVAADPLPRSIKDLGSLFQSPWKKRFIPLLGETRSLDEIEHDLIRGSGRYEEPRIHFAVNCASIGCPALREEAYRADRLDFQLEDATERFLADRTRNRFDGEDTLFVSSIFKWYRKDFERGWRGAASLAQFLALYAGSFGLNEKQTETLGNGGFEIRFLDYDWGLNDLGNG